MLESGTLGTKCSAQMVVPHVTRAYKDQSDPEALDIPLCTLKMFPYEIEHCIEWSRDKFMELFNKSMEDFNDLLRNPTKFQKELKNKTRQLHLKDMKALQNLFKIKVNADTNGLVQLGRDLFYDFFNHLIRNLLNMHPPDKKVDGQDYWSGTKKLPSPFDIDMEDPLHIQFVLSCTNIFSVSLGLPQLNEA